MKQKLYKVWIELGDLIPAKSEEEAKKQFLLDNGIQNSLIDQVGCVEFDSIMKDIKEKNK
jgi:hypothetical protein